MLRRMVISLLVGAAAYLGTRAIGAIDEGAMTARAVAPFAHARSTAAVARAPLPVPVFVSTTRS